MRYVAALKAMGVLFGQFGGREVFLLPLFSPQCEIQPMTHEYSLPSTVCSMYCRLFPVSRADVLYAFNTVSPLVVSFATPGLFVHRDVCCCGRGRVVCFAACVRFPPHGQPPRLVRRLHREEQQLQPQIASVHHQPGPVQKVFPAAEGHPHFWVRAECAASSGAYVLFPGACLLPVFVCVCVVLQHGLTKQASRRAHSSDTRLGTTQ